jgi:ABC-type branched-subunit amino acid transport system substrate-binding protein
MAKNYAIVIGINKYARFDDLKYAKKDAENIRDFFDKDAEFDCVFLLSEDKSDIELSDGESVSLKASFTDFHYFLDNVIKDVYLSEGDNFWFFFSGHGFCIDGKFYLAPTDGNPNSYKTGIEIDEICRYLRRCGDGNVILIIDACRSEGSVYTSGAKGNSGEIEIDSQQQGVIKIFSCSDMQTSYEFDELENGAFTSALLEGFKLSEYNCAPTAKELEKYLRYRVPELCRKYNQRKQTPYINIQPTEKSDDPLMPQLADRYRIKSEIDTIKASASWLQNIENENRDLQRALLEWKKADILANGNDKVVKNNIAAIEKQIAAIGKGNKSTGNSVVNHQPQDLLWLSICLNIASSGRLILIFGQSIARGIINYRRNLLVLFLLGIIGAKMLGLYCFPWENCPKIEIATKHTRSSTKSLFPDKYFKLSDKDEAAKASGMELLSKLDKNAFNKLNGIRNKAKQNIASDKKAGKELNQNDLAIVRDPELLISINNANLEQSNYDKIPKYKIAAVVPIAAEEGNVARHFLFGIAQAQDEAIKRNIGLQIEIFDQGNTEEEVKAVATKLANDTKNILGVVGPYLSETACKTIPIYNKQNLTVISPGSREFGIREKCLDENKNPNTVFFRTAASTLVEAESLVKYLSKEFKQDKDIKVVAFYNPSDEYSRTVFENFKMSLAEIGKGKFTIPEPPGNILFDVNSKLQTAIQKAKAIAVFPDGKNQQALTNAINIIRNYGKDKIILAGNTLYFSKILVAVDDQNKMPKAIIPEKHVIIAVDWHPEQTGAKAFAEKSYQYWEGDINFRAALAYESTKAFTEILKGTSESKNRLWVKTKISEDKFEFMSDVTDGKKGHFEKSGDRQEKETVCVTPKILPGDSKNKKLKYTSLSCS